MKSCGQNFYAVVGISSWIELVLPCFVKPKKDDEHYHLKKISDQARNEFFESLEHSDVAITGKLSERSTGKEGLDVSTSVEMFGDFGPETESIIMN